MTKQDISEIFALFKINYQSAPIFRGNSSEEVKSNLNTTIALWESNLSEVDSWTGLSAAEYIIQHNKYFPSIAEYIDAIACVQGMISGEIAEAFSYLKSELAFMVFGIKKEEDVIKSLPLRTQRVLKAIGGLSKVYDGTHYYYNDFYRTYEELLRTNSRYVSPSPMRQLLPHQEQKQIGASNV